SVSAKRVSPASLRRFAPGHRFFRSGVFQAALLSSYLQLVSSEAPSLPPHYRSSSLLRASPTPAQSRRRLCIPDSGCGLSPLPGRVSQVPRLIFPCALHPLTPGSPASASTHFFLAGAGFIHIRRTGHFLRVTRPKRFRLRCGSQVCSSGLRQENCSS